MSLLKTNWRWAAVPLAVVACLVAEIAHVVRSVEAAPSALRFPQGVTKSIQLNPSARAGELYALTLAVKDPAQMQAGDAVHVTVKDAQGEVESKWLHPADLDFYL